MLCYEALVFLQTGHSTQGSNLAEGALSPELTLWLEKKDLQEKWSVLAKFGRGCSPPHPLRALTHARTHTVKEKRYSPKGS